MRKVRTTPPDQKDYSTYPFMNLSLNDMKGEIWEDIPNMDGYFKVSNYGRVWALERPIISVSGQFYSIAERIRKQHLIKYYNTYTKDYTEQLVVNLRYQGKAFRFLVNRLVYHSFISPIDFKEDKLLVVHKDGDNCNNRVKNLVLMTGTELYGHGLAIKRRPRAGTITVTKKHLAWNESNHPRPVIQYTLDGKKVMEYESVATAATANNVRRRNIREVANKMFKQLHGFVYRFKGDRYRGEHADFSWAKSVTQYSIEGKRIASYPSVKEASLKLSLDFDVISKCALRKLKTCGGYVWRYQDDFYSGEYNGKIKNKAKPVIQYTLEGKTVNRFESVSQACIETGFSASTILDCANKKTRVSHGYVWCYQGDVYKGGYKHYRRGKPVTQFTLTGKRIQTYSTIESAARASGLTPDNIQKNVKGENKTAGGFIWRCATDSEIKALPPFEQSPYHRNNKGKEVVQYSIEGKKIASYITISEAAKDYDTSPSCISAALDRPGRTGKGFVWRSKGNRYKGELAKNPPANAAHQVIQYSLDGKKIKVFKSMKAAEKETGISSSTISSVARGKLKTTGGFIWKTGNVEEKIDIEKHFASTRKYLSKIKKPVIKYSLQGKPLAEFASITEAARSEGVAHSIISATINNKQKSSLGFLWKLKGE